MPTQTHLLGDRLRSPGYLSSLDILLIRRGVNENTEEEFQEFTGCSTKHAMHIVQLWEIAQVELWNAEILLDFFPARIYENRDLVAARIAAAQHSGRLPPGRFKHDEGLQWMESTGVMMGTSPQWIKANARRRWVNDCAAPTAKVEAGLLPQRAAPVVVPEPTETRVQRQDRRLQACIDAGLSMNAKAALSRLPDGVGNVAAREGVTRQAFSTDVKTALRRAATKERV